MVSAPSPTDRPAKVRLVVLFGGRSAEHEVSRISARHVLAAADPDRYEIVPLAITKAGDWVLAVDAAHALADGPDSLPDALPVTGETVDALPALRSQTPIGRSVSARTDEVPTVVFPLLHGPLGEDGTVQGLLELADVAYVGCGVLASALAMDKAEAKEVFAAKGIPQARHLAFTDADLAADPAITARIADELGFPVFVKPANMGSSIGVSRADDPDALRAALDTAFTYDRWVVVEERVDGREIECAVLGNDEPRASLPGEIIPGADFYDYEDKYFDGTAKLLIPAPLPDDVTAELRQLAVRAYRALRGEGMARVDFFYEEGGRGLLVNEVNTIPGFTPISMYPKMWEATGLAYGELIDELVRLALERHGRRRRRVD